jgi:hypothetical protein
MTDPRKEIVIDVGANQLDLALLKGFIGVSAQLRGLELEQESTELHVRSGKLFDHATVLELLRVVGGSCKGDYAIRVLKPEVFQSEVAVPYARQGPERWACPRCNRDVMAGANDAGQLFGLCEPCWSTEMRLAGVKDPKIDRSIPAASASIPTQPANDATPVSPLKARALEVIAGLQQHPPEALPAEESFPGPSVIVLEVRSPSELPAPRPGLFAVSHARFYWATSSSWFYCDGHVPVVL